MRCHSHVVGIFAPSPCGRSFATGQRFSLVEVFMKVTIVLAMLLEEDSVLLRVFQLCYVPIRAIF